MYYVIEYRYKHGAVSGRFILNNGNTVSKFLSPTNMRFASEEEANAYIAGMENKDGWYANKVDEHDDNHR